MRANRILSRLRRVGTRIYGRAVVDAKYAAAAAKAKQDDSFPFDNRRQLTLSEACRILNVKPPQLGKMDMEIVMERFKRLFDANEPENGGSFYLQSKILRARERIEVEVRDAEEKAERERELEKGWKPRLFR